MTPSLDCLVVCRSNAATKAQQAARTRATMLAVAALPTMGARGKTLYAMNVRTIATIAADDTKSLQVKPMAATPVRLMWKAPRLQSALSEHVVGSPGRPGGCFGLFR